MAQDQEGAPSKWLELNADLLYLISRQLDFFDFIRFRAVCKSWYYSLPLSDLPPLLPFLLSDDFMVYSLHTGQTHSLHMPKDKCRLFFGQSHGYLITYERLNFTGTHKPLPSTSPCLFNPFTMAQRNLPFHEFTFFSPVYLGTDALPNFDDDMVIHMSSLAEGDWLSFRAKEDKCWHRRVKISAVNARIIYKKTLIYCCQRLTTAFDLMTGNCLWVIPLPYNVTDFCILVEADGSLLGIVRTEKCSFEVYQLEENKEPPCWVQLSNIGDQMIFLNRNDGFSLSASSFNGIRGNCIYFTVWNRKLGLTSIVRYDLGKKSAEMVGSSKKIGGTWIVPNLCKEIPANRNKTI